ncbi:MAG: class I SAM-dependent methyltransferase [Bacteroidetes bacterium]|nr:class I SAM-dependent methyltransferase [Bacteroidota bacterium]
MKTNFETPSNRKKFSLGVVAFFTFIASAYYIKAWYPDLLVLLGNWKFVVLFYAIMILGFGFVYYLFLTFHLKIIKRINDKQSEVEQNFKTVKEYTYDRVDCVKFYDAIADVYDIDNSKEIWVTHRAIAKIVYSYASKQSKTSILDIGGGTGTLLFDILSLNEKLDWTYVDISKNMCSIFKQKSDEQEMKVEIINNSFDAVLSQLKNKYDIIVLSFLFSSLPIIPDLTRIINLLKDGGIIIFADADREYTKRLPYKVLRGDTEHKLLTKPWKLSDVHNAFMGIGFKVVAQNLIKKNMETYSHIVIFQK